MDRNLLQLCRSSMNQRTRRKGFFQGPRGVKTCRVNTTMCTTTAILSIWLIKSLNACLVDLRNLLPDDIYENNDLSATAAPYLDFDPITNRVILNAPQFFFDEVAATLQGASSTQFYLNERLYDIFVELPYVYVSITGELNYRMIVRYNNNNIVPKNVRLETAATVKGEYQYRVVKFVHMFQESI